MTDAPHADQPPQPQRPQGWGNFILYVLTGFGLYTLATTAAALAFGEFNIWLTFTITLLSLLVLGGTFYFLGVRRGKTSFSTIGMFPPIWRSEWFWLALGISIVFIPLRAVLGVVVELILTGDLESLTLRSEIFTGGEGFTWLNFGLSLLGIGLLVPISEELYFRGLLHGFLQGRLSFAARVMLSSLLFGLAHIDSLAVVVSSFIVGVINAIAFEKSGSIWLPISIHAITNLTGVILIYLTLALS